MTFLPDIKVFGDITFHREILIRRIRELAFLNPGLKITFIDHRQEEPKEEEFLFDGGLSSYVDFLENKIAIQKKSSIARAARASISGGSTVESGHAVEQQLSGKCHLLHQQHPRNGTAAAT